MSSTELNQHWDCEYQSYIITRYSYGTITQGAKKKPCCSANHSPKRKVNAESIGDWFCNGFGMCVYANSSSHLLGLNRQLSVLGVIVIGGTQPSIWWHVLMSLMVWVCFLGWPLPFMFQYTKCTITNCWNHWIQWSFKWDI